MHISSVKKITDAIIAAAPAIRQSRNRPARSVLAPVLAGILAFGPVLVSSSQASAIEGGWENTPGDTDMAQIWQKRHHPQPPGNDYRCSGTVISPHRILTATHCFLKHYSNYYVNVGRTELGGGPMYAISHMESRGDLTILAIDAEINIKVPYPQLAPNKRVPVKEVLSSAGWGRTCDRCGPSPHLKYADTIVNDNHEALSDLMGGPAYRVKALQVDGVTRLHPGDSGGPSYDFQPDGDYPRIIHGVTSKVATTYPTWAYMSATYDVPGRQPVHDWLRQFGQMKVAAPADKKVLLPQQDKSADKVLPNGMPTDRSGGTPAQRNGR